MTNAGQGVMTEQLTLPDELVLTLLNEDSGYFRQVPGWSLNCAVVGAALAELSLIGRIDTDMNSLILLDKTPTGDPCLDPVLKAIAAETAQRNAQYWIERLAPHADAIIDTTLERLCEREVLQHHDGDFWSLAHTAWRTGSYAGSDVGTAVEFVKTRISRTIFNDEIPDPRDVIIICLIDTCDVLRYIFELDEETEERVAQVTKMDLIGRAIADAVHENIARPLQKRGTLSKSIPVVPLRKMIRSQHARSGNLPALFAELGETYGPVFELRPPFSENMIVLVGPETNHWVHRQGRTYLRSRTYMAEFEKLYGGSGILPALDGADHFRYRKSVQPGYSRGRLEDQLDECLRHVREHMATWNVGDKTQAVQLSRELVNSSMSPLSVNLDTNDIISDLCAYKVRALKTHIARTLPKFTLKTPAMKRKKKLIGEVVERVLSTHTPAQRAGCPRNLADDLLSMHATDRQFLPESNLRFALSAPLLASMYTGDELAFIIYAMFSQPEFHEKIRAEADAIFANGDPSVESLTGPEVDVTRRFIMECMRMYPIVPMSIRNVMNSCTVEGYELPEGARVVIATTATHYMSDLFTDPFTFDIDRYLAPRKEHLGTGYAPYGLGTHTCLGARWTELHLALNLLMIARYFNFEIAPKNYQLKISPFPSMSPNKKLKFLVAEKRNELVAS